MSAARAQSAVDAAGRHAYNVSLNDTRADAEQAIAAAVGDTAAFLDALETARQRLSGTTSCLEKDGASHSRSRSRDWIYALQQQRVLRAHNLDISVSGTLRALPVEQRVELMAASVRRVMLAAQVARRRDSGLHLLLWEVAYGLECHMWRPLTAEFGAYCDEHLKPQLTAAFFRQLPPPASPAPVHATVAANAASVAARASAYANLSPVWRSRVKL